MRYRPRPLHGLILLGALLAGVWIFLVNLDPQTLKAAAVARVHAATGRTLVIEGDLQVAWWPKLAVRMEGLMLGNAPGFDERPMVALRRMEVAIALLPLLRGELELDTLRLDGLTVNLERRQDGSSNWDDLVTPDSGSGQTDAMGKLAALALGGVDITDTGIHWWDELGGREIHLTAASLQSAPLAFGEPVEFAVRGTLAASQPALEGPLALSGTALYDPVKRRYTVSPLGFEARLSGKQLPGGRATLKGSSKIRLDPKKQQLRIEDVQIEGLGHRLDGEMAIDGIDNSHPAFKGNFTARGQDLALLLRAIEHPVASRVAAIGNRAISLESAFKLDPAAGALTVSTLSGQVLGSRLEASGEASHWGKDTAAFSGEIDLRGSDFPGLVLAVNQVLHAETPAQSALARAMARVGERGFMLRTRFAGDLGQHALDLPEFVLEAMGTRTEITLASPADAAAKSSIRQGTLKTRGRDLAGLVLAGGSLQGMDEEHLALLSSLFAGRKTKGHTLSADLWLDPAQRQLRIGDLQGDLLGNQLHANLLFDAAKGTDGDVVLGGPDFPALLGLLGAASASSLLVETANRVSGIKDQAFTAEARLDRDQAARRITLSPLRASAFGMSLEATLAATGLNEAGMGEIAGDLTLKGRSLEPLVRALGQEALASRIDTVSLNAAIKGSTRAVVVAPATLRVALHSPKDKAPAALLLAVQKGSANLHAGTFNLERVVLEGPGLSATGDIRSITRAEGGLGYEASLQVPPFDLRELLRLLGQPEPATRDARALRHVGLQARAEGHAGRHVIRELELTLDDSRLSANALAEQGDTTKVEFTLAIDELDADRYLGTPAEGKAEAITPEVLAVGAMRLPRASLRKLNLDARASCKNLRYAGARLSDVELTLQSRDGKLALAPVKARLYDGRYQGDFRLDVSGEEPVLESNTTLAKVNLGSLLQDVSGEPDVSGLLNFEARLSTRGNDSARQLASLGGPASFAISDGELRGLDVPAILRAAELTLERKRPEKLPTGGSTRFRSLSGSLDVERGIVHNRDLLMEGEGLRITGEGVLADLPRRRMDYRARLRVPPTATEVDGDRHHLGDYEIPIRCEGPLAVKSCTPDMAEFARKATGRAVQKGVGKLLDEKAGGAGKAIRKLLEF